MSELKLSNITKNYGKKQVLDHANVSFYSNEITCLVGRNGVGKTTLLKLAGIEMEADSGSITLDDKTNINKLTDVLLIQDKIIIPSKMKICDVIKIFENRNKNYDTSYILSYLEFIEVSQDVVFGHLSKGNQEVVQMALLLSNRPKFILFDEPFAAVDIKKRDFLYEKIIDLSTDGVGIVISSHIVSEIQNVFSKIIVMKDSNVFLSESVDGIYNRGYDNVDEYIKERI